MNMMERRVDVGKRGCVCALSNMGRSHYDEKKGGKYAHNGLVME